MTESAESLVDTLATQILDPLVTLLFVSAIVYFIYGVIVYIANADNEEARQDGRQHITYSIIGLTVMAGVWGIIELIANTLGADLPSGYE